MGVPSTARSRFERDPRTIKPRRGRRVNQRINPNAARKPVARPRDGRLGPVTLDFHLETPALLMQPLLWLLVPKALKSALRKYFNCHALAVFRHPLPGR